VTHRGPFEEDFHIVVDTPALHPARQHALDCDIRRNIEDHDSRRLQMFSEFVILSN
jgi:hypothetical protein